MGNYEKEVLRRMMNEYVVIVNELETLDPDANYDIWINIYAQPDKTAVLVIDTTFSDVNGNEVYNHSLHQRLVDATDGTIVNDMLQENEGISLMQSDLPASGIRFAGDFVREFPFEYKRGVYTTFRRDLGSAFVDAYVEQVDKAYADTGNGLYLTLQWVSVGPNSALTLNDVGHVKTSFSRRQSQFMLANDLFYNMNDTELAEQNAIDWLDGLNEVIVAQTGSDLRMTWGTFGDLNISTAWPYYYDSEEVYQRLIDVKTKVDPTDIFRHDFTIPVRFMEEPTTTMDADGVATYKLNIFCF